MNPTILHPDFASQLLRERHLDGRREAEATRLERAVRRAANDRAGATRPRFGLSVLAGFVASLARRGPAHA